jgi:hypothetical protein
MPTSEDAAVQNAVPSETDEEAVSLMGAWLDRDLFDEIPEGVPPLEPEEDDEGE